MGILLEGVAYWTLASNVGCSWGWGELVVVAELDKGGGNIAGN